MSEAEQTSAPAPSAEPKIIKRYTNRKLYDTVESRYVTLDEISEMVKSGTEVRIIDNRSKEDLTSVTLAQIIFEEEKKTSRMPLAMLREIIRHGGEALSGFLQHQVDQVNQRMASIREEAEGLRDRLLRREGGETAGAAADDPNAVPGVKPTTIDQARELVLQSQRTFEEWQKRVDERVRQAVENISSLPALAKDMAALQKRIEELEKQLDELETK